MINAYNINTSGQHGRLVCVYLCWHVHEENRSDGSLSLAVTLVRTEQTVSLQDVEEALLPADTAPIFIYIYIYIMLRASGRRRSPVTSSRWKHFVEGKLPMEVPLNDVDPGWIPLLAQQLLKKEKPAGFQELIGHIWAFSGLTRARLRSGSTTHLVSSSVLLPFDLPPGEVEPGPAPQRRRDPLLTSFFHLFFSTCTVICCSGLW